MLVIVITHDGKRHELQMPHEPHATEWFRLDDSDRPRRCTWQGMDAGKHVYREWFTP
jgi:hypothetical protein